MEVNDQLQAPSASLPLPSEQKAMCCAVRLACQFYIPKD